MAGTITGRCDRAGHALLEAAVAALLLLVSVTPARAEWTVAAYLGSSFTRPATLTLTQPAGSTRIPEVHFGARPFASPPYYGYRAGWGGARRLGIEAELIHLKVYAHRADLPQNIERFSISHGLNLLLGNIVWRTGPDRRVHLELRAGAGIAVPHGESEISGVTREQYEVSSLALQAAAGPIVRLADHLSAFAEYKLTTAAPSVSVAGGHISGRYTSQHALFGIAGNFGRRRSPR
jgi:hypothetical protein